MQLPPIIPRQIAPFRMTKARVSNQKIVVLAENGGYVGTFGLTTIGVSESGYLKTSIGHAQVVLPEDGELTKISFYTKLSNAGNMKVAIYKHVNGGSKLIESSPVAVGTSWSWVDFPMVDSLTAGIHWLGCIANQTWWYKFNADASQLFSLRDGQVYPTFPDGYGYTSLRYEMMSMHGTCE